MTPDLRDPRSWWLTFGVLFGLGAAGLILIIARPRRGKPIELQEAPSPGALDAAGGPSAEAELVDVNLAREMSDGKQEHIPEAGKSENTSFPINVNTASVDVLTDLPSIGPSTAQAIIDYRNANGSFARNEDIQNVAGIGPATFETIKDLITTG